MAVPLSKPLRRGGFIRGSDGQRSWVDFKYEHLPLFCHFCGLLGYDLKHCAEHYSRSRNGDEVVCQYREWLKFAGGCSHSPLGKGSTMNSQPLNEARTKAQVENNSLEVSAAEYKITKENPNEDDSHAIGKNVKSGISTVCTESVSKIEGIIMESLGPPSSMSNIEAPILNWENISHDFVSQHMDVMLPTSSVGHVGRKEQARPHVLKQKRTWTRMTHMDCGLGKERTETSLHKLG